MHVNCQLCSHEIPEDQNVYQHFVNGRLVKNCEACEPDPPMPVLKDDTVPDFEESACAWRELVGID